MMSLTLRGRLYRVLCEHKKQSLLMKRKLGSFQSCNYSITLDKSPLVCNQVINFLQKKRTFSSQISSLDELENLLNKRPAEVEENQIENALKLEYEFFHYNGQHVPTIVTKEMWDEIGKRKLVEDRLSLYRFYALRENYKKKHREKKSKAAHIEEKKRERITEKFGEECDRLHDEQGLSLLGPQPCLVRYVSDERCRTHQKSHLQFAHNFGQPLVFDLGVRYQMKNSESSSFLFQLKEIYGNNRTHFEPFNLYLCNYNQSKVEQRELVDGRMSRNHLWNVTSKCFTEVFPKEKIVYLTRQSTIPLRHYSHDSVYVFGATVDLRGGRDDMSKIKELGLNHAWFDLNSYFVKQRSVKIPLNLQFLALMEGRDSNNWIHAMRHFPRRIVEYRQALSKMNHIEMPQEKLFVNNRSIFQPTEHNINHYTFKPPKRNDENRSPKIGMSEKYGLYDMPYATDEIEGDLGDMESKSKKFKRPVIS